MMMMMMIQFFSFNNFAIFAFCSILIFMLLFLLSDEMYRKMLTMQLLKACYTLCSSPRHAIYV